MKRSDKGKKVFGLIAILVILGSVFGGAVSADDLSGGLKQSVDDVEIQTAVDEEGHISNPVTRSPEKHAIIPSKNASRSTVSLSSNTYYVPDNYAKIQWAVDNASDGDTIIVRDGTHIENVNVDKRLTIRSENGPETTIVQAAKSNDAVFSVSSDYVNISGFTVKGASGLLSEGIDLPFCSNVCIAGNIISQNNYGIDTGSNSNNNNIWDNTISSNKDSGIMVMGSSHIITGNTISDNGDAGIDIWSSSNNFISDNTISNNRVGINLLFVSTGNTISGNTISDNGGCWIWDCGIDIGGSSNNISDNTISNNRAGIYLSGDGNTISGNSISSNNGSGIKMYGAAGASDNTLSSNTVSNNNGSGILTAGTDNIVTNNIVSNNNGGIKVDVSTNNQITNNIVLNSRGYGIHVYGHEKSHFDNVIDTTNTVNGKPIYYYYDESNEVIDGLDTTHLTLACCSNFRVINSDINNGDGVYLPHSNNNLFDGNDISTNNVDGIYLPFSYDNSISDNIISSNSNHGIHLWGSDTNEITDNTVSNNDDGIYLFDSSDNNIIADNKILSNNEMGVYLLRSDDNEITGNTISNNDFGIYVFNNSDHNSIYHNDFTDNTNQAYDTYYSYFTHTNSWDNGPVDGGNYWNDHICIGNPSNGAYPYFIGGDANAIDYYPFQDPIGTPKECDGTDTSCGIYPNCENCNEDDGCYPYGNGCEERNYYCVSNEAGCDYTYLNRHTDDWVDAGNTRWVPDPGNDCREKEQKEQEYRDYSCSGGVCTYSVTDTQWLDTGTTRNKPDGTDCGSDEWADTGNTRWIDVNECKEKEQKEQEYRDYACSNGVCTYSVTDTQWLDTGTTRNKDDGTICDCTASNTLKRCYGGVCTDTGICDSSICGADAACDGKRPGDSCGANKKCDSNCKCGGLVTGEDYGVFRNGLWFVDTTGDHAADDVFGYGFAGATPLVGDIDQDGTDDIAIVGAYGGNYRWFVDTTGDHVADEEFWFGFEGAIPLVGDIDQDGTDDIAIVGAYGGNYRWFVDTTGDHVVDEEFWFGFEGAIPLVGDIDQDGTDDIAIVGAYGGNYRWFVDTTGDHVVDEEFWFGFEGAIPLVGDIDQDGTDDIAIVGAYGGNYRWFVDTTGDHVVDEEFWFGFEGAIPLVGDFDRDRTDDIAIVKAYGGNYMWFVDTNFDKTADQVFWFGFAGATPLVGDIG